MGSLNGDVVVIRNGRSTSQVSIYNYPEHLNPFYEDDQHKRLRFWKISKKDNEGRRNSFSIGNLKDMWAFKSFRLKKKSSTLGISKTSESPPPLRREYVIDNGWNSFDHRLRGSTTSSINGDSFQRNVTYRSSLQNLPSNNDRIGFNRNDDYRSTIQVPRPSPRYHHQQQRQQPQTRRSSQSSMVSTNPFESDIDDDNEDVNAMRSLNGGSTTELTKSTQRKKRRAPAPPTPIRGHSDRAVTPTIVVESSQNDTQNDLCIREDMDIANLTAEIENFVKDKSNEDVEAVLIAENKAAAAKTNAVPDTKQVQEGAVPDKLETTTIMCTTYTTPTTDANDAAGINGKEVKQSESKISTPSSQGRPQTKNQITTEIVTVKTTSTINKSAPVTSPATSTTDVSQTTGRVVEGELQKDTKSNGATPKKSSSTAVNCVTNDNDTGDQAQSPTPVQRTFKPGAEVGHVECIHLHVESPRATPRQDHANRVTSFKKEQNDEAVEMITTRTPFILTSPPRQRKSAQNTEQPKATVKFAEEPNSKTVSHELSINEEQIKTKPDIMAKPTLSPKPKLERNDKAHTFAEIHKPMRSKVIQSANGHVRRSSRDELVTAPTVPHQRQAEEQVIVSSVTSNFKEDLKNPAAQETLKENEVVKTNLKIEENTQTTNEQRREVPSVTSQSQSPSPPSSAMSSATEFNGAEKRETNETAQLESLYRPQSHMEWKRSTLAPLETNIPPEKRKSVKDIIESINRSQRLLHAAANKDFTIVTGPSSASPTHDNSDENLRILDENQREIRRMVQQIDHLDNNAEATSSSAPPSYNECIAAQKLDNNEIFQKCKVQKEGYDYRESSPISSNLDWNPVPKPKRTKPQHE